MEKYERKREREREREREVRGGTVKERKGDTVG